MHASRLFASLSGCALALALSAVAQSQAPAAPATRPTAPQASPAGQAPAQMPPVTVTPPKVNFGKVGPESVNPATFTVTNVSGSPLKIVKATPSCKCTAISPVEGKTIEPGQSIDVSASLKTPSTPGIRDAKVFLMFEGYRAPVILELVGDVVMDVVCEPPFVDALQGRTNGTIKVFAQDGKPFRILSAGAAAPVFAGATKGFDPAKDQPLNAYEIAWNVAGLTALPIWWVVETDRASAPLLPLRVRNENTGGKWDMARFDRQWHLKDGIVFIGALQSGKPLEYTIELEYYNPPSKDPTKARAKKPNWGTVKSVKSKDPTLTIEVIEHKQLGDEQVEIKIRVTGSTAKTIYTDCIIETETGSAHMPLIAKVS
jgi:Protein of unknown function (DUF1573)